jgi:toxin ParE1/3/4
LLPAAEQELDLYSRNYEAEAGRGLDFLRAMESVLQRIREAPAHGPAYLHGTRRLVAFRFPFSVIYIDDSPEPVVVAFAHHSRKPGHWARRLTR